MCVLIASRGAPRRDPRVLTTPRHVRRVDGGGAQGRGRFGLRLVARHANAPNGNESRVGQLLLLLGLFSII